MRICPSCDAGDPSSAIVFGDTDACGHCRSIAQNDPSLLAAIYRELDGVEWSPDTLDAIARILTERGCFVIREPE